MSEPRGFYELYSEDTDSLSKALDFLLPFLISWRSFESVYSWEATAVDLMIWFTNSSCLFHDASVSSYQISDKLCFRQATKDW